MPTGQINGFSNERICYLRNGSLRKIYVSANMKHFIDTSFITQQDVSLSFRKGLWLNNSGAIEFDKTK